MALKAHTLLRDFLAMLAAERGAARNTILAYERDLDAYLEALAQQGKTLLDASTEAIRSYMRDLQAEGFSAASIARKLSAIRQLHGFLYLDGHRADDPTTPLQGPRKAASLPKVLSIADVDRLLGAARAEVAATSPDKPAPWRAALRLLALVELLYATGLRVSELVSLPANAIASGRESLIIKGKGGKARRQPGKIPLSLPGRERERAPAPAGVRARVETPCRHGGAESGCPFPPCAPARFCDASGAERRGFTYRPAAFGPCGYRHNANLHPCAGCAGAGHGARSPPPQ
jgi:integrase